MRDRLAGCSLAAWGLALAFAGSTFPAASQPITRDCERLRLEVAGTGELVAGAEDIAVDHETGIAYLSARNRWKSDADKDTGKTISSGGIFALYLNDIAAEGTTVEVRDLTRGFRDRHAFRPHGLDLYRTASGRKLLLVVNLARDAEGLPSIERFEVRGDEAVHLGAREGTIRGPLLCSPNEVTALDSRRFFATSDHGACSRLGRLFEDVFTSGRGHVVFYDGDGLSALDGDLGFPNGIALLPAADVGIRPGQLAVSLSREEAIQFYDLVWPGEGGVPTIKPVDRLSLDAAPDNLVWGSDGRLYAAALPQLWRYALYRERLFGVETTPSRVLTVEAASAPRAHTVFADDGSLHSGSTVAVRYGDRLLVGAGFEPHILACRLSDAEAQR